MAFSTHQQIFEAVETSKEILIAFKKNYNGDNLGGAIALFLFLQKIGKRADIICDNFHIPAGYAFLHGIKHVKSEMNNLRKFVISLDISRTKVDEISYDVKENELDFIVSPKNGFFEDSDISSRSSGFKYDLIFTIGAQDLEELGNIYDQDTDFFYKTTIVNLDYIASNENFGQINCVNLTATSVCDILFNIFIDYNKDLIDDNIATALLAGIISSTKNFKSNKVTPATLNIASRLIAMGARRSEIVQNLYHANSLATLKLWGRILSSLKSDPPHKLVWSLIRREDFSLTEATEENLDNVVEELIANSHEVETVVMICEDVFSDKNPLEMPDLISEQKNDNNDNMEAENYINIPQELYETNIQAKETDKKYANKIYVMLFSLKNINSLELAKNFPHAKGNDYKAKFCLSGATLESAEEIVIKEIKTQLDQLQSNC